jgi:hypothetical protein
LNPPSPAHGRIIQTRNADGKSATRFFWLATAGILLLSAGLKAGLLLAGAFPFNADEAVVGLMARHILQGAWPTFFYGQAYMGSLDASLVAGAFALLGPRVDVIRLVQLVLYVGIVLTTIMLGRRIFGPWPALLAGLFMTIPTVNLTLYTTVSLGGYAEALLIGNLLLIAALSIVDRPAHKWTYLVWGFLSGLGLWAFGLTLVYVLPSALLIALVAWPRSSEGRRDGAVAKIGLIGLGGVAGASPWIAYAIRNGMGKLLSELGGSAIVGASPSGLLASIGSHTFNLVVFGTTVIFGLRPPWEVRWLAPVLIPVVSAFWIAVIIFAVRILRNASMDHAGMILLAGVVVCLCGGFVLTPFGADPSGRYFTPLAVPIAIFGGGMLDGVRQRFGLWPSWALVACVLVFNLWGTIDSSRRNPPGLTTQFNPNTRIDHSYDQALIEFLSSRGEMRGYTNYWVAYPLAFLSSETEIYIPRLPYHPDLRYTPRDDRYAPYDAEVWASGEVAYITTGPVALDTALEGYLSRMGVDYREADIGDYHVYYGLSQRVSPPDFTSLRQE